MAERRLVYAVDERPSLEGQTGGGGIPDGPTDRPETGELSLVNERPTLVPGALLHACWTRPGAIWSSHITPTSVLSPRSSKTDAGYSTEVVFDDTALVLFRAQRRRQSRRGVRRRADAG